MVAIWAGRAAVTIRSSLQEPGLAAQYQAQARIGPNIFSMSSEQAPRGHGSDTRSTHGTLQPVGSVKSWCNVPISMPSPPNQAAGQFRVLVNNPFASTAYPSDLDDVRRPDR
jgi:hypothetical protein